MAGLDQEERLAYGRSLLALVPVRRTGGVEAIAELSTQMHMQQTMQSVGTAVLKQTMEMVETQGQMLVQNMQASNPVSFGHQLDVRV